MPNDNFLCPFYVDRWSSGTSYLSPASRGIYIELLFWQWRKNRPIPNDQVTLCRIAHCTESELAQAWTDIAEKFVEVDGGLLNMTMEDIRTETKEYHQSRREKASHAAKVRWSREKPNAQAYAQASPMHAKTDAQNMPSISHSNSSSTSQDPDENGAVRESGKDGSIKKDHRAKRGKHVNGKQTNENSNPRLLLKLAHDLLRAHPDDPDGELRAKLKDQCAGKVHCDSTSAGAALDQARAALSRRTGIPH